MGLRLAIDWISPAIFTRCLAYRTRVGLYKVELINNPNMITIAVIPKEYIKKYRNRGFNNKHKGVRKKALGIDFDSYGRTILSLKDHKFVHSSYLQNKYRSICRLRTKKWTWLPWENLTFSNDILSLPFDQLHLPDIRKYKKESEKKMEDLIFQKRNENVGAGR